MEEKKQALISEIQKLVDQAKTEGVIQEDFWAELKNMDAGPRADLSQIEILGEDTMAQVREAYVQGRASQNLILSAMSVAKNLFGLLKI